MELKSNLSYEELKARVEQLERRIDRERAARESAERLLEEKSLELYQSNSRLVELNNSLEKQVVRRTHTMTSLLKSLNSGILLADEENRILLTNQKFRDWFSIDSAAQELLGKSALTILEKSRFLFSNPQRFLESAAKIFQNRTEHYGGRCEILDGRIFEYDFVPIYSESDFLGFMWQFRDVTQEAIIKRQIEQSEEKYRGLIENMQLGLLEVDVHHTIVKAYPSFCEMTGYTAEELIGKNAIETFLPPDQKDTITSQDKLRQKGQQSIYETQLIKKNGDPIWVLISGAPFLNDQGELIGSMGIHYDITYRKRLEEELRNSKMQTEKLRDSEKQFLANMSHEIRNPINAIVGITNLLYDTKLDSKQQDLLEKIKYSADILQGLIAGVLDFAKIESGTLELAEKTLDLASMIQSLVEISQFKCQDKNVRFITDIDSTLNMHVHADPTVINQIFLNLINNAIKFTSSGYIFVSGEVIEQQVDKIHFSFSIKDTGIGIPADRIDLIFDNFQQADKETKLKYGGTGLGLTIVRRLVETYGGHITAKSEIGNGSEFIFDLWLQKSATLEEPVKYDVKSVLGKHMLIVEDNKINQQYLSGLLQNWEITFDIANNGSEAVELVQLRTYDMILMDIRMPVMDGYEATIRIRSGTESLNQSTPIVALTASALVDEKERALAAGMNFHLTKPFSPAQLAAVFKKFDIVEINISQPSKQFRFNPALDVAYLQQLYDDDLERAQIIFEIFVEHIKAELVSLESSYSAQNWAVFSSQAHKLKPNFFMIGASELGELMREFEKLKDGPINGFDHDQKMTELREKFEYYYDIVLDELSKLNSYLGI